LPQSFFRQLLIACLLPLAAAGQVVCALGLGAAGYKASEDKHPTADAMQLVGATYAAGKSVCGANCPEVILFRNTTASDVMLVNDAGRAKIVYNPVFITSVYDRYGDPGVEAVVAHEIGHALDDALGAVWIEKSWTPELRADSWAGCILAKSNLAPADVTAALAALQAHPSPAHPAWNVRLPAIRAGYSRCGGAVKIPQ
jgi:hypothetical protein